MTTNQETTPQATPSNDASIVFGLKTRTWAIIILIVLAVTFLVFIIAPYVLAMVAPLLSIDGTNLVGLMDGVALIVGITGTIASIASIIMTFADKKRYNREEEETKGLIKSVSDLRTEVTNTAAKLHNDVKLVADEVTKTFQQNARLGLALYDKKVIDSNPNLVDVSVSPSASAGSAWQNSAASDERPISQ